MIQSGETDWVEDVSSELVNTTNYLKMMRENIVMYLLEIK